MELIKENGELPILGAPNWEGDPGIFTYDTVFFHEGFKFVIGQYKSMRAVREVSTTAIAFVPDRKATNKNLYDGFIKRLDRDYRCLGQVINSCMEITRPVIPLWEVNSLSI